FALPADYFPSYSKGATGGAGWVIAIRTGANTFDYDLPITFTSGLPGNAGWGYPGYYILRCRKVYDTTIIGNGFGQNCCLASIDLDFDGDTHTQHRNNILSGTAPQDGIKLPSNTTNLAGWSFDKFSSARNTMEGNSVGWTGAGTVANANGQMRFQDLPGQAGVFQPGPYEGQKFNIKDSPTAASGNFATAVNTGGGGNHVKLRRDNSSWRISG